MSKKGLQKLISEKDTFDDESKVYISSLQFVEKEIGEINSMKQTAGWKIMEKKIREELQSRIVEAVKDDQKIQVLLSLLQVVDTKNLRKTLNEEIAKLLPEE